MDHSQAPSDPVPLDKSYVLTGYTRQRIRDYGFDPDLLYSPDVEEIIMGLYGDGGLMECAQFNTREAKAWSIGILRYITAHRGLPFAQRFAKMRNNLRQRQKRNGTRKRAETKLAAQGGERPNANDSHPLIDSLDDAVNARLIEAELEKWKIDLESYRDCPRSLAMEMEKKDGLSASFNRKPRKNVMIKFGTFLGNTYGQGYHDRWSRTRHMLRDEHHGFNELRREGENLIEQQEGAAAAQEAEVDHALHQHSTDFPDQSIAHDYLSRLGDTALESHSLHTEGTASGPIPESWSMQNLCSLYHSFPSLEGDGSFSFEGTPSSSCSIPHIQDGALQSWYPEEDVSQQPFSDIALESAASPDWQLTRTIWSDGTQH